MKIEGTPEEIVQFADEIVVYVEYLQNSFRGERKAETDKQKVENPVRTLAQALQEAVRGCTEDELLEGTQ